MEMNDSMFSNSSSNACHQNDAWPGFESGYAPAPYVQPAPVLMFANRHAEQPARQTHYPQQQHVQQQDSKQTLLQRQQLQQPYTMQQHVHQPRPQQSQQLQKQQQQKQQQKKISYCFCRKSLPDTFMIQCDVCQEWFHGACVNIHEEQGKDIEKYHCKNCVRKHGPLTLKNRPRWWEEKQDDNLNTSTSSHDCGTSVSSSNNMLTHQPVSKRNGCPEFLQRLEKREFTDASEIPVLCLRGEEITIDYLANNGFTMPILVSEVDGLGVTIPPNTVTARDIEDLVGSMKELDVIDVAQQRERKMLMREWVDYYTGRSATGDKLPERCVTLNLISLEFSATSLGSLVEPPNVVKELSWVDRYWPTIRPSADSEAIFLRPEVQKYCLMSVAGSYTDFHVDFGGTSVWYHILRGEKIFYLIRPTPANLARFEDWYLSAEQSETFLPDLIDDVCYRAVLKAGQTVFLPSGWIHAVLTPQDSMVFGGNFLHSLNVDSQLRVYAMERRTKTPEKYFFPNFETVHWYVAEKMVEKLRKVRIQEELAKRGGGDKGKTLEVLPVYLLRASRSLLVALKAWSCVKTSTQQTIPDSIRSRRLLSDLEKLLKYWGMMIEVEEEGAVAVEELLVDTETNDKGPPKKKRLKKANHFIR